MENLSLSFILDGVIVVLLMATILYAARLSIYLKNFKESRSELEGIIKNLATHINKAEMALQGLNKSADEVGEELQSNIDTAQTMRDELDMVVRSADSLANRLEELAVRNRRILDGGEGDLADLQKMAETRDDSEYEQRLEKIVKTVKDTGGKADSEASSAPFSIRDPELERGEKSSDSGFTLDDNEVLSEAERDLYEAMQKRKSGRGA